VTPHHHVYRSTLCSDNHQSLKGIFVSVFLLERIETTSCIDRMDRTVVVDTSIRERRNGPFRSVHVNSGFKEPGRQGQSSRNNISLSSHPTHPRCPGHLPVCAFSRSLSLSPSLSLTHRRSNLALYASDRLFDAFDESCLVSLSLVSQL
jgi:hypothetical protein